MATSVWLFKPRCSHGRKKEDTRARNGAQFKNQETAIFWSRHWK